MASARAGAAQQPASAAEAEEPRNRLVVRGAPEAVEAAKEFFKAAVEAAAAAQRQEQEQGKQAGGGSGKRRSKWGR